MDHCKLQIGTIVVAKWEKYRPVVCIIVGLTGTGNNPYYYSVLSGDRQDIEDLYPDNIIEVLAE